MDPDLALLERWRAGDKPAGEELFRRHFPDIFRFFDGKVSGRAEDLTQQTFLECVRSRDNFRAESTFRTYLFGIAWNELRRHLRRELRNENLDFEVSSLDQLSSRFTSPSSVADRVQQSKRVQRALAQLPVAQQILLEYHYWHELKADALGEIFSVPPGTIRVRLLRARNALRRTLEGVPASASESGEEDSLTASLAALEADDRLQESVEP
jgi:RNA polymerase sigma-70 factor (ECF subfamily)